MRAKRKRVLYLFFLLITVMMFFHSLQTYMLQREEALEYAHAHHKALPHTKVKSVFQSTVLRA